MKRIKWLFLMVVTVLLSFSAWAQGSFEGILTTRVSVGGIDMSALVEKIDYQKGDVQQQMRVFFQNLPAEDMKSYQSTISRNPMIAMALIITPPKAVIYLKNGIALAKTKGLGYEIQHYHNQQSDEAFIYTASLINPQNAITAAYKPSEGYLDLFTDDKRITSEQYTVEKLTKTIQVAGYTCSGASYTPKLQQKGSSIHKLLVYTSKDMPTAINFSHPYYFPEEDGIMRIDIFMDDSNEPVMVYEITDVQKTAVDNNLLQGKKNEPLYELTDLEYGMKVLGIVMGGMKSDDNDDDDDDDE